MSLRRQAAGAAPPMTESESVLVRPAAASPGLESAVLVVGTGLIGTSIALALRDRAKVLLADHRQDHLEVAALRGAGEPWDRREPVGLAVLAVPPRSIPDQALEVLSTGLVGMVTHVASVQSRVAVHVQTLLGDRHRSVCGGHPLAGREVRGPGAADGRLFAGRPWAVCPVEGTLPEAVAAVEQLALACGAVPVRMSPDDHDAAVAAVSHLPQLVASALAAQLADSPAGSQLALAGPGLQDTTRIAASDAALWTDILRDNAAHVAPLVRGVATDLTRVAAALERLAEQPDRVVDATQVRVLSQLLERGNLGRARVPGKPRVDLAPVVLEVEDRPGQLAAVLATAATAGLNVEDVRVEHLRGRPRGLVELLVQEGAAEDARRAMRAAGWQVVGGS